MQTGIHVRAVGATLSASAATAAENSQSFSVFTKLIHAVCEQATQLRRDGSPADLALFAMGENK